MIDWEALKLKPLTLTDIPSELEWCVYPEEKEQGKVLLPATVFQIVLALRWILTHTDDCGLEAEFEAWKVYWKNEDEYGFRTHIFLFREKVEQFDNWDDAFRVLQPQTWTTLATLACSNGRGVITDVHMVGGHPYGGKPRLDGLMGVRRLLEDAVLASQATHNYYPFQSSGDYTCT